jgi:hypothetical protein
MPINKSNIIFIGNAGGICGYLFKGVNIVRKSSSLTGRRVAEDPAFKGFRNSGNRMKQASPIASSLYNLLPKEHKVFALYRTITGEALKMIKQGINVEFIKTRLKEEFIDPILENSSAIKNHSEENRANDGKSNNSGRSNQLNINVFKTLPFKKRNIRTIRILQYAESPAEQIELSEPVDSNEGKLREQQAIEINLQPTGMTRRQKKLSQFSEFIYMGRLQECKGLKMWLRPCTG